MDITRNFETIVIGGGQAGLAVAYHLRQRGRGCLVLDAGRRVGDNWRHQWDSLTLYSPAKYDGLPGLPFPAPPWSFPGKDAVGDYLEDYARHFDLPVQLNTRVTGLRAADEGFVVTTDQGNLRSANVVVATGTFGRTPNIPEIAAELDPSILQLDSTQYRRPEQLADGEVLVVGASHSGPDIAFEVALTHPTILAGRDCGQIPPRIEESSGGLPVVDGAPREVANIIWATGFRQTFDWIDLPILGDDGWPRESCGVVPDQPGLFFCGLSFQSSFSSMLVAGVGRDAAYVAGRIDARSPTPASGSETSTMGIHAA